MEYLYHYTTMESAEKIVVSGELLFNRLEHMNDMAEFYRPLLIEQFKDEKKIKKLLAQYWQVSLTEDREECRGFAISAMWGHYASKGRGVCLVFDKGRLLGNAPSGATCKRVCYENEYDNSIFVPKTEDAGAFLERNREALFFTKTNDWSYEQELRILARSCEAQPRLPLGDSLLGIIMNFSDDVPFQESVFNSVSAKILRALVPDTPLLELGYWEGKANARTQDGSDFFDTQSTCDLDVDI